MNWTQLIDATADRAGLTKADARRALEALREVAADQLASGEAVPLYGLGTLRPRTLAPRSIRHIQTYRKVYVGERRTVSFRPAAALRRAMQGESARWWRDPRHQAAWRLAEALIGDLELYHARLAPDGLNGDDRETRDTCAQAFGDVWSRVLEAYATQVPAEVRRQRDHLAEAARARWP